MRIRVRPSLDERVAAALRDAAGSVMSYEFARDWFGADVAAELVRRGLLVACEDTDDEGDDPR